MKKSASESLLSGLTYALIIFYLFVFFGLQYGILFLSTWPFVNPTFLDLAILRLIVAATALIAAATVAFIGARRGIKENNLQFESEDKSKSFFYGVGFSLVSIVLSFFVLSFSVQTAIGQRILFIVFTFVELMVYSVLVFKSPKIKSLKKNSWGRDYHLVAFSVFLFLLSSILLFVPSLPSNQQPEHLPQCHQTNINGAITVTCQ